MSRVLKQSKTITGYTSLNTWTWKQVIDEYFEDDSSNSDYYLTSNKSFIVVKSYIGVSSSSSSSYSFGGTANTNITCNGESRTKTQNWIYQSFWIAPGGWKLIQEETFTVQHNTDGNKTITVSSSLSTTQFNPNSANASGEITLTYIPRKTLLKNVSDLRIQYETLIPITPASTVFTHSLRLDIGETFSKYINPFTGEILDEKEYIFSSPDTSFNLLIYPDVSLYLLFGDLIIDATLTLTTYNGEEKLGEDNANIYVAATYGKCAPKLTSTSVYDENDDIFALTKSRTRIVAGQSDCKVSFEIQVSDPNDINTSLTSLIVNDTILPVDIREYHINKITNKTITIYLENSRGYKQTFEITIEDWIPYVSVGVNPEQMPSAYFHRGEASMGDEGSITTVFTTFGSRFYDGAFGIDGTNENTFVYNWRYKEREQAEWSQWYTIDTSSCVKENGMITVSNTPPYPFLIDDNGNMISFEYHTEYDIEYKYTDLLTTVTYSAILRSGVPVYSWSNHNFKITDSLIFGGVTREGGINYFGTPVSVVNEEITKLEPSGYYSIDRYIGKKLVNSNSFFNNNPYATDYDKIAGKYNLDATTLASKQNGEWVIPTCWADIIYPIGSIYMSINKTNPANLFGGEWEQIKDVFLLSAGDKHKVGDTGGEETHKLTVKELPEHNHAIGVDKDAVYSGSGGSWSVHDNGVSGAQSNVWTGGQGNNEAHNNMPPYLTVYMWKRIA